MYVKTNNGSIEKFPYSIDDLRKDNPNTSFPHALSKELLEFYGVFFVAEQAPPETDKLSYCVKRHLPELIDGQWVMAWDVIQKTAEQLEEETNKEAEAIRNSRNKKLAFSDWTQLDDSPGTKKLEWATYRQELRDLPTQAGFPWQVDWPTAPEA
jgi:hypothetical protein